ncbi:putative lipid II flippase FtsW [Microbacterium sp. PMIC_1C1B]|uniref:Probable peptidoglycan glycosyltransferase FtsW n=1 Tax=Microbacterium memoriense TaxID=2978350 RepID=A0ABT2P9A6_9MICO|nr:putative lipid II flippase FtsW [Microbacterium memoriense]MCT9001120.1 putative lipid II flippase FtsW [Microbacterium memoriense]
MTPEPQGYAARVSLGRVFTPVPSEFLLIASTALLLTGFGLVMVLSATMARSVADGESPFEVVLKQGVFAIIGIPLMFVASRFPVSFWKKIAWPALIVTTAFQLLVFVPGLGVNDAGNRNWINIAGMQMQPSEFLKLSLALWLGYVLYRKQTLLGLWRHVFIPVVPVGGLVIGTVLGGHDLGTAMILMAILLGCLFFSGVKLRIFVLPLLLVVAVVAVFAVTSPNRMARILSNFNVDTLDCYYAAVGDCYQAVHGVWGLANGGIFGLGLGNSREKYGWLPAQSNDYIFAILGEELGLIGCLVVLALFTLFAVGSFHVIRKTHDPFVRIVAGGITVWVVGQAVVNIGVVLRIFPVLGVPLPFMSQGGTALLSVLLACGVLLSFARSLPARTEIAVPVQRPGRPVRAR